MGLRAFNNPKASFEDPYSGSGTKAWKPYVAPQGLDASGGLINDYESGGTYYRTHMFQGPGTFVVSGLSNDATLGDKIDVLLVGGGGGGAGDNGGGGGAGGAYFYSDEPENFGQPGGGAITAAVQTYPVTIGAGGWGSRSRQAVPGYPLGMPNSNPDLRAGAGQPGGQSIFASPTANIITAGSGGGGGTCGPHNNSNWASGQNGGTNGGSGGGSGWSGGPAGWGLAAGGGPPNGWHGGVCPPGPGNADTGGGGGANVQPAGSGKNGDGPTGSYFQGGDGGDGMICKVLGPMLPDAKSYWAGGGGGSKTGSAPNYDGRGGKGGLGGGGGGAGSGPTPNVTPTGSGGGYGFTKGGDYTFVSETSPYQDGASDTGDMSYWLSGGRFTGAGGGGTGGGGPDASQPWNPTGNGRQGMKGMRGGKGGEGCCIVRYKISNLQMYSVKATGGYTSQYNNKTIHVFVEPGTFTNTSGAPLDCEVVTIAGGGGGGFEQGGGGGAGGMLITPTITVGPAAPNAISVGVGAGGLGQAYGPSTRDHGGMSAGNAWPSPAGMAQNGANSTFGPTITAIGGGAGGQRGSGSDFQPTSSNGNPGGSGGGSGAGPSTYTPGSGTPTQGYAGGNGAAPPVQAGGGGGGAGGAGGNISPTVLNVGGTGGIGKQLPTTFRDPQMKWGADGPSPGRWFCGGGGGGSYGWNTPGGPTGSAWWNPSGGGGPRTPSGATPWAGGGNGGCFNTDSPLAGCDGMTNTGGGGGGGGASPTNGGGGHGGPGIVFVAYDNPAPAI